MTCWWRRPRLGEHSGDASTQRRNACPSSRSSSSSPTSLSSSSSTSASSSSSRSSSPSNLPISLSSSSSLNASATDISFRSTPADKMPTDAIQVSVRSSSRAHNWDHGLNQLLPSANIGTPGHPHSTDDVHDVNAIFFVSLGENNWFRRKQLTVVNLGTGKMWAFL